MTKEKVLLIVEEVAICLILAIVALSFNYFIFPSLFEGLGISLIEAQASGVKILTSKNVIPPEVQITDLIEYIDLTTDAKIWASKIKDECKNRKMINEELIKSEYNIKKVSIILQELYMK